MLWALLNMILTLLGWIVIPALFIVGSIAVKLFRNGQLKRVLKDGQGKLRRKTRTFDPDYIESEFIDDPEDEDE